MAIVDAAPGWTPTTGKRSNSMSNVNMSEAARSVIELIDVGWEDFKSGNMTRAQLTMQEAQVLATLLVAERLLEQIENE